MSPNQYVTLFAALIAFSSATLAEPLNVMVGDVTFTRPATWTFESPGNASPALTRFVIPPEGGTHAGDVRFYINNRDGTNALELWSHYFEAANAKSATFKLRTIGKRQVAFVIFYGTLLMPGEKPAHDQGFVGVVIPFSRQYIHVRFNGPRQIVQTALPEFTEMIERAVMEAGGSE